jgi:serine phosphatase RsbU (regulator of sigma subunit)
MEDNLKILLVEDSDTDADLLIRYLKKELIAFSYVRVWIKDNFVKALDEFQPDLIISDHSLPQFHGMEAFQILKSKKKNIPFILITGTVSEKLLTEYMKEGIDDYILKDNLLRLPSAIENVVNKKKIENLHNKLTLANSKLESAYSDIKDSINYASFIQRAILPTDDELEKVFAEFFIFYKPKDVVSGDFYSFTEKDGKIIIAVVDCTGHGVPGAFMSMIGNDQLNHIILEKEITMPAGILMELNKGVKKALKQKDKTAGHRDGMDIAICSIDYKTSCFEFAGAMRPLLYMNGELKEIKADKAPIAGNTHEEYEFTNHVIPFKKGEIIYLSSDGYVDQFGGKKGRKFMTRNFKKLLTSIHSKSMKEQGEIIDKTFEEWRGNLEQVDDVLIMGIRF